MTKKHNTKPKTATGYFKNGLPYIRIGNGPRDLVAFQGGYDAKPPSGLMLRMITSSYKGFGEDYTVYSVFWTKRPGLPTSCSMRDISDDYAAMIKEEFAGSVDIMGISTGGSIAQHFAADHPELVRRLVLCSSGYRLGEEAREGQRRFCDLARQGKWRKAFSTMIEGVYPSGIKKHLWKLVIWIFAPSMAPADPSHMLMTMEAEDKHDFKDRLAEIKAPTLVIGGGEDHLYPIRETAAGIPNAKLILYEGFGHSVEDDNKRQFQEDVLAFLKEGASEIDRRQSFVKEAARTTRTAERRSKPQ